MLKEACLSTYRHLAVAVILGAPLVMATSAAAQGLFEFCDDFAKTADEQRDPYEERLETERHDFTQSAVTVGYRVVQVESGYSYFYKDADDEIESAHTTPELLLRVGLTEDIEFRVRWNYAWIFPEAEPDAVGSEDLRYALKLQMTREEECCWRPTSALEVRGTAPTGGEEFTTDGVEFSLDYIYQWQLREGITVAGSTGFGTNGFGDIGFVAEEPQSDNFTALSQSAVVGLELSEQNTMYLEWYGIFSHGLDDEFVVSVFNIGIDHYATEDFVIDLRAGVGLTDDSDDFFVGIGGGRRF